MFKPRITYPLSAEITFDLENINEFLKSGITLPNYDSRKFSERKVFKEKEGSSIFDKYSAKDLHVTFRIDILPGPKENVDIFYHVAPSIHASVFSADIYTSVENTLTDYQKDYCSKNQIGLLS